MSALPEKPSELIRVAITDLIKCEEDPNYRINMADWHRPQGEVCEVCLAGAVMAQRIGVYRHEIRNPVLFPPEVSGPLLALDDFRMGCVSGGLERLDIRCPEMPAIFGIIDYSESPEEFKYDMRSLAQLLEDHGL